MRLVAFYSPILVSSALREYALLDKEVVWVGVGNRMEIWDVDKWKENSDKFTGDSDDGIDMEELSEYMAELGI